MERKIKTIEFICTGNNGRSKMEEAIAENYVVTMKGDLTILSSGIKAGPENDLNWPYEKVMSILKHGQDADIYNHALPEKSQFDSNQSYKNHMINEAKNMLVNIFRPVDKALAIAALAQLGLRYKEQRTQTVANPDVDLVLATTPEHAKAAESIYSSKGLSPTIDTIAGYSGTNVEFPDLLGVFNLKPYTKMAHDMSYAIPIAIEKALRQ